MGSTSCGSTDTKEHIQYTDNGLGMGGFHLGMEMMLLPKNIFTTAPKQQSNQLELLPTLDGGVYVPPGGSPSPSSPRKIPLSPCAKNPA
eukprot:3046146-Ditylum_brightwellii.AAC.1